MRVWVLVLVVALVATSLFLLTRALSGSAAPATGTEPARAASEPRPRVDRSRIEEVAQQGSSASSAAAATRRDASTGLRVHTRLRDGTSVPSVGVRAVRPEGSMPANPADLLDSFGAQRAALADEVFELSGDDGRLVLELEPGSWALRAEALAVIGEMRVVEVGENQISEIELTLPSDPWTWFHGRVLAADTSAPLGNARLAEFSFRASERTLEPSFDPVASNGDFRVRLIGFERRWFEVRAPGRATQRFVPSLGVATSAVNPFVIELEPSATMKLRAVDSSGRALAGIELEVRVPARALWAGAKGLPAQGDDLILLGETDGAGEVVFEGLPPSKVTVVNVDGDDRREVLMADLSRGRLERDVVIGGGALVAGRILDERGESGAGVELRLVMQGAPYATLGPPDSIAARSDDAGRFEFSDVRPGAWRLVPQAPQLSKQALDVLVPQGQARVDLEYELWSGVQLTGVVLDENGAPAPGVDVIAQRVSQGGAYTDQTDGQGRFVLDSLGPGQLRVFARRILSGYGVQSSDVEDIDVAPRLGPLELRLKSR